MCARTFTAVEPFAVFKNALKCNKHSVHPQNKGKNSNFLLFRNGVYCVVKKRDLTVRIVNNEVQKIYKLKCVYLVF